MVYKNIKDHKAFYTSLGLVYATVTGKSKIVLIHFILLNWEYLNTQDVFLLHTCNI